jgi:hypothetical protein
MFRATGGLRLPMIGMFRSQQVMLEDHELQRQEQAAAAGAVPQQPHPGYSLVVLLSGTRGGAVQLHDSESGAVMMRQQLHAGPVVSISVRTWRMGECGAVWCGVALHRLRFS